MIKTHPLATAWCFTLLCVVAALVLNLHQYPIWIKEGGIVESLSALGYFVCVAVMLLRGGPAFAKKYHYLLILITLFAFRELDFDKRFTTLGVLKSRFYTSDMVPAGEKIIGVLVILLLLYVVYRIVKGHLASFIQGLKNRDLVDFGNLSVLAVLVFSKSIDGLDRKLADFGVVLDPMIGVYAGVIEEVLELGIPVLIFATFAVYLSQGRSGSTKLENSASG
jgi:hypothetical protein